jgi:hypothetical protein
MIIQSTIKSLASLIKKKDSKVDGEDQVAAIFDLRSILQLQAEIKIECNKKTNNEITL